MLLPTTYYLTFVLTVSHFLTPYPPTVQVSLACQPMGLPPLADDHRSRDSTVELVDFILPSYQFTCHGLVTSWRACVDPGGNRERYDIKFLVWRPSTDGCFTVVGINVPSELLAPQDHCVQYSVPLREQVEVFPGDVIGFYVDRYKLGRRGDDLEDPSGGGVQLDTLWSRSVELLSLSPGLLDGGVGSLVCGQTQVQLASVGSAPVLSASVGERECV